MPTMSSTATVTILDDDSGISFSSPAYVISETNAQTTVTVLRSFGTNAVTRVNYATTNGTARALQSNTSRAENGSYDFVSRFFAPRAGVPEDPVTGSAHCALGPYWGKKLGKTELLGRQLSSRGGTVRVRLEDGRVMLGGHAVTVLRGVLI